MIEWFKNLTDSNKIAIVVPIAIAVIGGLISEIETKFQSGVPLLKDIPLLGGLFRLTNDAKKKRELIIFVTPKIIGT